jgi:DNA-binding NtrC family response regulator
MTNRTEGLSPNPTKVLVVDDEQDASECLKLLLEHHGYEVRTAPDGKTSEQIRDNWHPDLALMDVRLPDVDGLELLKRFRQARPATEVIMVTGYGSVSTAVDAMKTGAFSFVEKPIEVSVVLALMEKASERAALSAENETLRAQLESRVPIPNLVGGSPKMQQLFEMIKAVAPTDASVLIHGENGTGKELVAEAIHQLSKRSARPFIKINCAAIPSELIESELFGHGRGAFTGAVSDKIGLIEMADGGSLLLDEIAEMPAHLQAKLLRVLQEREFRPVGQTRIVRPNFRLMCATNINIEAALSEGKIREDLYFRINTVSLPVPALRERPEDIPLLAEHFLGKLAKQHQRPVESIAPEARRLLQAYRWPGNVRELENVMERAIIMTQTSEIGVDDLPEAMRQPDQSTASTFVAPQHCTLAEIEKLVLLQTLERTRGNKREAARILGVYRPTLYSKLKKHKLDGEARVVRRKDRSEQAETEEALT